MREKSTKTKMDTKYEKVMGIFIQTEMPCEKFGI